MNEPQTEAIIAASLERTAGEVATIMRREPLLVLAGAEVVSELVAVGVREGLRMAREAVS